MSGHPRVALFCETFHEINGVALTARQLVDFARRQSRPFFVAQSGPRVAHFAEGSVTRLELPRGWFSFGIERDLRYDLMLWRHLARVRAAINEFRPDAIHVTSPGEFGQLGAWVAHTLRLPLVASWHTNLHQFAARRLQRVSAFLPGEAATGLGAWAERSALRLLLRFYGLARVTLAPTPEQVRWLEQMTGRPSFLMPRGVDCELFHPRRRTANDRTVRLGFVGRITPEKGVRLLADIERALLEIGLRNFSIAVIGDGSEKDWLRARLTKGSFPGILRGESLAEAYANLDLFVFPSRTDTFGNVIQEAAASGVPSVVTAEGGPQHLVVSGVTGRVCKSDAEFVAKVLELVTRPSKLREMGRAARQNVLGASWDAAFEMTYAAYRRSVTDGPAASPATPEGRSRTMRPAISAGRSCV